MLAKLLLSLFFQIIINSLVAQQATIPLGAWRTHLPYRSAQSLALAETQLYVAAESGLFVFDTKNKSVQILSKSNGLAEAQATQIAYHSPSKKLIVGYFNGNIDLIEGNRIINVPTIRNATNIAEAAKSIAHIFLQGQFAYLSTGFGVIVLDLQHNEIKETWKNLDSGGNNLAVTACTSDGSRFFIATPQGVFRANATSNLQDFANWQRYNLASNLPQVAAQKIAFANNTMYASLNGEGIYKLLPDDTWQKVNSISQNTFRNVEALGGNQLAICTEDKVILLNQNDIATFITNPIFTLCNSFLLENNHYWIADDRNGLIGNWEGSFKSYSPNGTFSKRNWRNLYFEDKILALSGGYNALLNNLNKNDGFDIFQDGFWQSYNASALEGVKPAPFAFDLNCAAYNPSLKTLSIGSFGNGIIQINEQGDFNVLDETSPQTPFFGNTDVKISALQYDRQGNLWVAQYGATQSLHQRRPDGSWLSYGFNAAARFPLDILIDTRGNKWIRLAPTGFAGGIWVSNTEQNENKHLTPSTAKLTNGNILSMAIDKNGVIWIGSESGVMTVFNSFDVFRSNFEVTFPIFERRQLLESIAVTAIAIDGANRKWFGTRNNGLFLFDANVSRLIAHFTAENSPLLSNAISHIDIHDRTGEVFISTEQGLCSYRDGVSEAASNFGSVKVFPNPVKPDFTGLVGIEGLAENAEVKITDISGKLFYQTTAKGGTATWNVSDYNGKRAAAGIYLVFSATSQGEEKQIAKIAVL
ncbi:MAG: two-component regulator propeller domain-containing protein [Raineya sp.]